jgi:hypothetical protein
VTNVRIGQVYKSNDRREHRFVRVESFLPGDSEVKYAKIVKVAFSPLRGKWEPVHGARETTIKVSSLGVTRQTGYSLQDG